MACNPRTRQAGLYGPRTAPQPSPKRPDHDDSPMSQRQCRPPSRLSKRVFRPRCSRQPILNNPTRNQDSGHPCPARIDASTLRRATRVASRRDLQTWALRRNRSLTHDEPSAKMSPANETAAVVFQMFFLQFFTAAGATGAPATHGRTAKRRRRLATGPARGDPLPERPIRPLWSAGNKNKQTQQAIEHPSPPFPGPTPPPSPPLTLPATPTTFLQVLDHPHSKLGVGGQAPTPPSDLRVAGQNRAFKPKRGCGTGAQAHENPTPTTPTNTTATRHHQRTRSHPAQTATATDPSLSAVTYRHGARRAW